MLRHWEKNAFSLNPVGYFYLKEVQENVPFNTENHFAMDLEFLLACSKKYPFVKVAEEQVLGVFRLGKESKTWKMEAAGEKHWQPENFTFIDQFLVGLDEDFVSKFRSAQKKGYAQKIGGNVEGPILLWKRKIMDFLQKEEKWPVMKDFIKRTFSKNDR